MSLTILTNEILQEGRSSRGGWSSAQLALFGLKFNKMEKGWQKRIIGRKFTEEAIQKFLALKDTHLTKGKGRQIRKHWTDMDGVWQLRFTPNEFCSDPNAVVADAMERLSETQDDPNDFRFATDGL